jgi:hypothetical protein
MSVQMIPQVTVLHERFLTHITRQKTLPTVSRCFFKLCFHVNDFLHKSQLKGRSPLRVNK